MIQVSFKYDKDNIPVGFRCVGHASAGPDNKATVCAAVSALTINAINSVQEFTKDEYSGEMDEEGGYIHFELEAPYSNESKLLMHCLESGLRDIEKENEECISFGSWDANM